ncbi:hypothetical protein H0H93_002150 [Arthromyces matolae]|nr:hypothetical protein H0H93_002150 [Arthromyces matolae]
MAAEYMSGAPLYFRSPDGEPSDDDGIEYLPGQTIVRRPRFRSKVIGNQSRSGVARGVIFNFYHDIESVFWIYLWFLVYNLPKALVHEKGRFEALRESVGLFFRSDALRREMLIYEERRALVHEALLEAYASPFDVLVDSSSMAKSLNLAYKALSLKEPSNEYFVPKTSFRHKLYLEMIYIFESLLEEIKENEREKVEFRLVELSLSVGKTHWTWDRD